MIRNRSTDFIWLIEIFMELKQLLRLGMPKTLVFNLFQFGMIKCLYLSTNMEEISLFSYDFKEAVQSFKKNIARERTIFFKHFVYIGISNNNFPPMDEPKWEIYSEEQMKIVIASQLTSIFIQYQAIGRESYVKVLCKRTKYYTFEQD